MDTAGRVDGFVLMDPDGLLRAWELDLLLQGCLRFYFTLTPPRKEGAVLDLSLEPLVRLAQGGSAGFHPALLARFSKNLYFVLIIRFVLKDFSELGPSLGW